MSVTLQAVCLESQASVLSLEMVSAAKSGQELFSWCMRMLQKYQVWTFLLENDLWRTFWHVCMSKRLLMEAELSLPAVHLFGSCYFWPFSFWAFCNRKRKRTVKSL